MNRLLGIVIVGIWLIAFVALLTRDVIPYWQAQEPPTGDVPPGDTQIAILDPSGHRIGTSWTTIRHTGDLSTWQSTTAITPAELGISLLAKLPPVLFDSTLTFQSDGKLTAFETVVYGMPERIEVKGTLLGIDYSCVARFGAMQQQFSLDNRVSKGLGETLRPFTHLANLHVGQKWQIRLLDPLSLLTSQTPDFRPMMVEVMALDTIPHGGKQVECFRVESDAGRAVAWVDRSGRVLVQTVTIPVFGLKVTLQDEPFDEHSRRRARSTVSEAVREEPSQPRVRHR